jgi:hydroxymethylbilane synthase
MTTVRVATRASDLALAQARSVAEWIERELSVTAELVPMRTSGDRLAGSLAKLGGKGLFVKEIEEALLDGRADVAVHSAKDLPATLPRELELVACPPRADPRDALVARDRGATLAGLPRGARVGTGSVRRRAQLLARRPDLVVCPLRGNVLTRVGALESGDLDAVILACAGLDRLGRGERIDERIATDWLLPAVGQGVIAVEARRGTPLARDLARLSDRPASTQLAAERGFLLRMGGDCNTPLAALAEARGEDRLRLRALAIDPDGTRVARAALDLDADAAAAGGAAVAEAVLKDGGSEILGALSEASP